MHDLSEIPLFKGLEPALFELLHGCLRSFRQGEKLVGQGQPPTCILIIRSGAVDVLANGTYLVTRKRNEIIGEQAFVNEQPHSADCVAKSPVEALYITRDVWNALVRDPAFVRNLLAALSDKLRESTAERSVRFATEERLFDEFRSHLAPEVLNELLNSGEHYGDPRLVDDVAVLFSDIRGFTAYVHSAKDVTTVAGELSAYLSAITDVIHRHGGYVDKFIGDAIMAFWSYPGLERPHNDVIAACMDEMLAIAAVHTFGGKPAHIGIGVNQGTCLMGNVGSKEKRQFTILGDAVNIASRLEHKSKDLGSDVVVGATFFNGLSTTQQTRFKPHADEDVRGAGKHTIYSLKNGVK